MNAPRLLPEDRALEKALRDYQDSPGRYSIALREPRLLYECAHSVLLVAAGRHKRRAGTSEADATRLQQAARFFVRQACLRPGTDHYTLLGVAFEADAQTIREHYRLLIRLTHPDFASASDAWPPDTAARVNLAYDALSTPGKRSAYDEQRQLPPLKTPEPAARATTVASTQVGTARLGACRGRRKPARDDGEGIRKRKLCVFGGLAGFAAVTMLVLLLASTPPEDPSLRASLAPAAARIPTARLARAEPDSTPLPEPASQKLAPEAAPQGVEWAQATPEGEAPQRNKPASVPVRVAASAPVPAPVPAPAPAPAPATPVSPVARNARPAPVRPAAPLTIEDAATAPMKLGLTMALNTPAAAEIDPPALNAAARAAARLNPQPDQTPRPVEATTALPADKPTAGPLDMRALQPLLAELVEVLQSGSSVQVQQWIERAAPQSPSALAFASNYQSALGGGRVVGLGQVTFTPRATTSPQQVDGTVQLNLQYADQPATVRNFRLRAHFDGHPGSPKLSHLEAR